MTIFSIQKATTEARPYEESILVERTYRATAEHIELAIRRGHEYIGTLYVRQGKEGIEIYIPSVPVSTVAHYGERLFHVEYPKDGPVQ